MSKELKLNETMMIPYFDEKSKEIKNQKHKVFKITKKFYLLKSLDDTNHIVVISR